MLSAAALLAMGSGAALAQALIVAPAALEPVARAAIARLPPRPEAAVTFQVLPTSGSPLPAFCGEVAKTQAVVALMARRLSPEEAAWCRQVSGVDALEEWEAPGGLWIHFPPTAPNTKAETLALVANLILAAEARRR